MKRTKTTREILKRLEEVYSEIEKHEPWQIIVLRAEEFMVLMRLMHKYREEAGSLLKTAAKYQDQLRRVRRSGRK